MEVTCTRDIPNPRSIRSVMVHFDSEAVQDDRVFLVKDAYRRLYLRVAAIRDQLERVFPECRQVNIGLVEEELLVLFYLNDRLTVAVCSDSRIPIFMWDEDCLSRFTAPIGDGFKVMMPVGDGSMQMFWYQPGAMVIFRSAEQVMQYVGGMLSDKPHWHSNQIVKQSDIIRAQIKHLTMGFLDLKVATFSRSEHSVKVYLDLQWRCVVHLSSDGEWRVECMDPDPIMRCMDAEYLGLLASKARAALSTSARLIQAGRVCANCAVILTRKMSRCPCNAKVYYCGRECQRLHWGVHKSGCTFRGVRDGACP